MTDPAERPDGDGGATEPRPALWRRTEVRARAALAVVVASCMAVTTVAVTGAEADTTGTRFAQSGHFVYNSTLGKVFGIDGGSKSVDDEVAVPGAGPGSRVVGTDTSGFVLSEDSTVEFGKSDLTVDDPLPAPAKELPMGLEAGGAAFAVYRQAGKIQRFGDQPAVVDAGGPVGRPVVTAGGVLWVHVRSTGRLCRLAADSERLSCPARLPDGRNGALTLIGDQPVFVDTAARELRAVDGDGFGRSAPLTGLDVRETSLVAPNDVDGRVAILTRDRLHLVDSRPLTEGRPAADPVVTELKPGRYEQLEASGRTLAMIDAADGSLVTVDADGRQRQRRPIPAPSKQAKVRAGDRPALFRGGDSRLYVDSSSGEHVMVVEDGGDVTDVEAVGRGGRPGTRPGDGQQSSRPVAKRPVQPPKTTKPPEPRVERPIALPRTDPPRTERPRPRRIVREPEPERTDPPVTRPEPPRASERPRRTRPPAPKPTVRPPAAKPRPKPATRPTVRAAKPGVPSDVTATTGNKQVTVTWGAAAANGSAITGYTVSWAGGSRAVSAGTRRVVVTGLSPGTYTFTVRARNRVGTGPGASAKATLGGAPDAPRNLKGFGVPGAVQLTWTRPNLNGGTFVTYAVNLVGADEGSRDTTDPALRWTGLQNGKRYTFLVRVLTFPAGGIAPTGLSEAATVTVTAGPSTGTGGGEPKIVISKGAAYTGDPDICDPAHCAYTRVRATNLAPDTTYTVSAYATEYTLHEGDQIRSDSRGRITLNEKFYNAAIGQNVWVTMKGPDGRKPIESNRLPRTS